MAAVKVVGDFSGMYIGFFFIVNQTITEPNVLCVRSNSNNHTAFVYFLK
jgi:hypothetical protein